MKKLRVTVEGKAYDVLVEMVDEGVVSNPVAGHTTGAPVSSASIVAPTPVASTPRPASAKAGSGDIASPLAGKVVSIDVKIGQAVDEGAQVATLEAMKMNTYIYSPKAGKVAAVLVNPGDGVEEGTVLLSIA